MHIQGERPTSTTKHPRSPGDVSNLTRTHQEATEQAREELHCLGLTQAKYILGTSNSRKPMYHKLSLDHAREWYRATKSVQEDQIYVKDQIYPDKS